MIPNEQLLKQVEALFVDREEEKQFFQARLKTANTDQRIYLISGEEYIGKSFLLFHFYLLCQQNDCLAVWIDFSKGHGEITNYLGILRDIQITLQQPFERYQRRTAENLQIPISLPPRSARRGGKAVVIEAGAKLEGHITLSGQYAAGDIYNFYLQVGNREQALQQSGAVSQLTSAFLDDLIDFVNNRLILFFFDDIGSDSRGIPRLDPQTRRWLIEDFVLPLYSRLPSARFVITQCEEPDPWLKSVLFRIAHSHQLREFPENQVYEIYREYLVKKLAFPAEEVSEPLLRLYHKLVMGKPSKLLENAEVMRPGR